MTTLKQLEVKHLSLKRRVFNLAEAEGKWVTIRGRAIFIKEGEDLNTALKSGRGKSSLHPDQPVNSPLGEAILKRDPDWQKALRKGKSDLARIQELDKGSSQVTDQVRDKLFRRKPDHTIQTGKSGGAWMPTLKVHYTGARTVVTPVSKSVVDESWAFKGRVSPADIKAHYINMQGGGK